MTQEATRTSVFDLCLQGKRPLVHILKFGSRKQYLGFSRTALDSFIFFFFFLNKWHCNDVTCIKLQLELCGRELSCS